MDQLLYWVLWVVGLSLAGAGAIGFVYFAVRVGSYAHFRTKLEYWRSFKKEMTGGKDGKV